MEIGRLALWCKRNPVSGLLSAVGVLLLGCSLQSAAIAPSAPLSDYSRQSWTVENGLPQTNIQSVVQTRNGFLWLGTEAGLVRFDGVEFVTFNRNSSPELPGNDIRCLLASRDGTLWIGTNAGLARWRDGRIIALTQPRNIAGHAIRGLAQNNDGLIWILTDGGLAVLDGTGAVTVRATFPDNSFTSIVSAGMGALWATAPNRLAIYQDGRWTGESGAIPQEEIRFAAPLSKDLIALARQKNVQILRRDPAHRIGEHVVAQLALGVDLPPGRVQTMLADREGSLWIGTSAGLARWSGGKLEQFPMTDPLATASVLSLTEDREGNLWVGTESSLDVLRDRRFRIIDQRRGLPSGAINTLTGSADGALWVGTQEDGVYVLQRGTSGEWKAARVYTVKSGLTSDVILSIAAASNGDVWVGTPDGLNRIHGGSVRTFTSADGLPDDFIRSLLADSDGTLWVGTRRGLVHCFVSNGGGSLGHIEVFAQANGLGNSLVGAISRDTNGDLWVATLTGLSRLRNKIVTNFTTVDGLSSNVVTALLPRADGRLLIGTEASGWEEWDGHRFLTRPDGDLAGESIHAIVDDDQGHLWFATGRGIARASCAGSTANSASICSQWMQFGMADGLPSEETGGIGHPVAWRAHDGSLWFATAKGLVEVDPGHFSVNTLPPPVALERFLVDDIDQSTGQLASKLQVPAGHSQFEFDYAGLSFMAPQKVRYRYRLEGFDRTWTEAGTRRATYYTNIPPGHYTFRVQAANNDGVWNTDGASFKFELLPHYYQTIWFYLLLLVVLATAVMLVVRQRLRYAEQRHQMVLAERTRIAREIHDTLAQGYVGVSIQLEILAELLRQDDKEAAMQQLDRAREDVHQGLADARQSIWALRTQSEEANNLPIQLRQLVDAAAKIGLAAQFNVSGAYRELPPAMEREVFRVAQEAIQNARKHSGADLLSVELSYGLQDIALEVRDNGRGGATDYSVRADSQHFGLTGMKERAAAIGGTLAIESPPGAGTRIRLTAPAR
jgi:signal transduction histidine kinase/ligand-binding sensor domain-containing protein